jgi:NitT/TauT family transport system ATP-binding protein
MHLHCHQLSKSFGAAGSRVVALRDVSLRLGDGEVVCLVGPSGCGKSTLLRIVAGLIRPDGGRIDLGPSAGARPPRSALVFQEHGLFPWMTVAGNVAFGLRMMGIGRGESRACASDLIASVGLEGFARRYPHELSVGMRQRVNLARALAVDPDLLLMDEPFAALDAQTRSLLQQELLRLCEGTSKSVLFVTHDIGEALYLGDRVLVMSGRPGTIRDEIVVPLSRPREAAQRADPRLVALERRIWGQLEAEVRSSLSVAS